MGSDVITNRHPSMVEYVFGSEAQFGLWTQHVSHEVDGARRHALPMRRGKLQTSRQNSVEQLLLIAVRRRKRRETAQ